jgi:integrase
MLTLQRRAEVATMRREDLDLEKDLWTIPAVNKKERRKGLVPLSPKAKEIIEAALARSTSKAGYVFPGSDGEGPLEPHVMTRWLARLRDRRAEAEARVKAEKALPKDAEFLALPAFTDVTVHDLRRTGRTKLTGEELDVDERTAERVLNHSVGSHQQKAYDWNAYMGKKREALKLWEAELLRIVEGKEPTKPRGGQEGDNVYPIRRSA